MSTFSTIVKGGLSIVSLLYPPAAPIIGIIEAAEPYVEAAIPLVQAAITARLALLQGLRAQLDITVRSVLQIKRPVLRIRIILWGR